MGYIAARNLLKCRARNANRETVEWDDSVRNEVRYGGYGFDAETGMYNVRNRNFHPTLGRWIERDPPGYVDGMNLYQYVSSDPVDLVDALGLCGGTAPAIAINWPTGRVTIGRTIGEAAITWANGGHPGIQVGVYDADGRLRGYLTADYYGIGTGANLWRTAMDLYGVPGRMDVSYFPVGGDRVQPMRLLSGTREQAERLLDWILQRAGQDRAWLDAVVSQENLAYFHFDQPHGFETYRLWGSNCTDFVDQALDA